VTHLSLGRGFVLLFSRGGLSLTDASPAAPDEMSHATFTVLFAAIHKDGNIIYKKLSYCYKLLDACVRHALLTAAALWWMTVIHWPDFLSFTYPAPIWRPEWGGFNRAIGSVFVMWKLEWLGYNLVKVAWLSTQLFWHNTSMWQTQRQPHRHSKWRTNAQRQAENVYTKKPSTRHRQGAGDDHTFFTSHR